MKKCIICSKELTRKQKVCCSRLCKHKLDSNRMTGMVSFMKGRKQSDKQKEMMRVKGDKCIAWRGGKFNNSISRSMYAVNLRREKFGFTKELLEQRLKEQNNKCAICNADFNESIVMLKKSADHCHVKNSPRGILCRKCNLLLGNCSDNIAILSNAITYLEHWKDK